MKNFILITICLTTLTGCFPDQEDYLFSGLFVEFDAITFAINPATFSIPLNDGQGEVAAQINLVGAHQDTDQEITVAIDPASTAVEGEHFTLNNRTTLIPANQSFGNITFTILDSDLPAGQSVTLSLVLEGNELIPPSENYKRQTYVIFGQ